MGLKRVERERRRAMNSSDLRREDNYNEYLRLQQNDDYVDVTFDEESGGMSAVHKFHKFDKQKSLYAAHRGDYERHVVNVLRGSGDRVVLESEISSSGVKVCDGLLNDIPMEIKAVEGMGTWTICTKLHEADKQHAQGVVLYFPKAGLFSEDRLKEGIRLYHSNPETIKHQCISKLMVIVEDAVVASAWDEKTTPEKEWLILEGLRGQNGANPFTIPPSGAKV